MPPIRTRSVGAILGLVLVLAGCSELGGAGDSSNPAATWEGAEEVSRDLLAVDTLEGVRFDPAATADEAIILWFWAPWCTICRIEAPEVMAVAEELTESGSPVAVIGVPGRGQAPEMQDFVADTGTSGLTHLVDADGTVWREYGIISQPAFALLSVDGEVEVVNGALGAEELRDAAARLAEG